MKKIAFFLVLSVFSGSIEARNTGVLTAPVKDVLTIYDEIWVGVGLYQPPCLSYAPPRTDFFYHLSAGNHITFVFPALAYAPCNNVPSLIRVHNMGKLPKGDYTMQVYMVNHASQLPADINDPLGLPLGNPVNFTVHAPVPVPVMGFPGALAVVLGLLLGLFWLKKRQFRQTVSDKF